MSQPSGSRPTQRSADLPRPICHLPRSRRRQTIPNMAEVPADERCKHGEIAAWCGESECMAERTGLPKRVWRTASGSAYHRKPTCQALLEGHRKAERYGYEAHPVESVPLADAMSAGLGECFHCFPENVPAGAKPCQIWSDGTWVDGFLLEWRRGADGQWKGLVNYRHRSGRRIALKDYPAELRQPDTTVAAD